MGRKKGDIDAGARAPRKAEMNPDSLDKLADKVRQLASKVAAAADVIRSRKWKDLKIDGASKGERAASEFAEFAIAVESAVQLRLENG